MNDDLKLLQGTWSIASLEADGKSISPETLRGAYIRVTDASFTTGGMGAEYAGSLEINDRIQPKTLAMRFQSGPETGNANFGIYDLHGDRWRICLNMTGGPAPMEFKTAPGTGHAFETLIRESA